MFIIERSWGEKVHVIDFGGCRRSGAKVNPPSFHPPIFVFLATNKDKKRFPKPKPQFSPKISHFNFKNPINSTHLSICNLYMKPFRIMLSFSSDFGDLTSQDPESEANSF
ncbi:hypothetical protein L6452_35680 [Arctium lappa]|uniref:Uncharacterized protein n=1 Tax=Arctium lappa TaxID=4217 RepID=A0ACB8Y7T8_ARCLA|nr:hypothetical protein L6452_35680 [Arctium lappa]